MNLKKSRKKVAKSHFFLALFVIKRYNNNGNLCEDFHINTLEVLMEDNKIISPELEDIEEERLEKSLRPKTLDEYIGQSKVKENMKVYIEAAKKREEPLDHVLLYGPPGLGKTTLANIISNEMNSNIKITSGPAIEKPRRFGSTTYKFV